MRLCSARPPGPVTTSTASGALSSSSPLSPAPSRCYSSEAGAWSEKTYVVAGWFFLIQLPPALMGNTLYFIADSCSMVVMYDLATQKTSLINLPLMFKYGPNGGFGVANDIILMAMENGGLGVARVDRPDRLSLWSREPNPNGDMEWTQIRVVDLEKPLPVNACSIPHYFDGFAHGGVLFVGTRDGLFSFDLKSGRVRKVCDEAFHYNGILRIVPYMSFYSPPGGNVNAGLGNRFLNQQMHWERSLQLRQLTKSRCVVKGCRLTGIR